MHVLVADRLLEHFQRLHGDAATRLWTIMGALVHDVRACDLNEMIEQLSSDERRALRDVTRVFRQSALLLTDEVVDALDRVADRQPGSITTMTRVLAAAVVDPNRRQNIAAWPEQQRRDFLNFLRSPANIHRTVYDIAASDALLDGVSFTSFLATIAALRREIEEPVAS
jgi:hypothetical protein